MKARPAACPTAHRNCVPTLVCACLLPLWCRAVSVTFVVSPTGNDRNPGTVARPFGSLGRAVQAVRESGAVGRPGADDVKVLLRGGTYRLSEPLIFGPADSGTADCPVIYASHPGERAVISGGRPLRGRWRSVPGKPYLALDVPEARGGGRVFHSLYVNGRSRTRARTPNQDEKVLRAEGRAPGEDARRAFRYRPGDIDPSWQHITDADLVLLCSWTPTIHRIQTIDPARRVVRFESTHNRTVDFWERHFRYYVSNLLEALDVAGEWYLDRHAGVLYYYPMPGENMAAADVIAPVLRSRIIEFRGDVDGGTSVHHLRFENLDIRHVDGDLDRYNGVYRQGHMYLDAAIHARGLRHAAFRGCELAQLGEYAIEIAEGCRDIRIERCHIWDIGAGAMQIGVSDLRTLLAGAPTVRPDDAVLEAETATLTGSLVRREDPQASAGGCVLTPDGDEEPGEAVFRTDGLQPGGYDLFARVIAPDGTRDSFTVRIGDGPAHTFDTGSGRSWFLARVVSRERQGRQLSVHVGDVPPQITVARRESGTRLDCLVLRPVAASAADDNAPRRAGVFDVTVDNNLIHRLGTIWHGCYGIVNRFASRTRITHNDISDVHWDAIGLDARWTYRGEDYSQGNVVAYNHLHHLGLGYHTDAGGVYQFGPLDTHIHHNRVHHTRAYPYICGYAGIYLDQQSRGARVENNLVHDVDWYAYFLHKGVDNVFRNNIGAFARDGAIRRGALNDAWRANHMEARRNVYVTDTAVAIGADWEDGERPPVLEKNLYYSLTAGTDLTFAGGTFADWQARGRDEGSVLRNPGFADAAARDFSLAADALACAAIGFVPFTDRIHKAGLYGDDAWTSMPSTLARRRPAPTWSPEDLARLAAFDMSFDDAPAGYEPAPFRLTKEGEATFAVHPGAGRGDGMGYRCTDRHGLKKTFYPYVILSPRRITSGRIRFALDVRQPTGSAAACDIEFRGAGFTSDVGPSLTISASGVVAVEGEPVLELPGGTWLRLEWEFNLGGASDGTYQLTAVRDGQELRRSLPFRHATFRELRWLGITAPGDADGTFDLDNLVLEID